MDTKAKAQPRHLGRKISRIRELLGVKQESLAEKLGISQQAVSKIEQSELVEDATVEKIARALGVTEEAIKNFNEDSIFNLIQHNNFHDHSVAATTNYQCTFNPIDKWLEAIDENKKLYEALLKSEREKVEMLQRMLDKN